MNRINVMKPWLGDEEAMAAAAVIRSGWVAQGPRVAAFEAAFAEMVGVEHAVALSSCTTALHLAMLLVGVGPGDDVVVPSFSFIATANAPTYVGARPIFADVDPITGNVTAETVSAALTSRTTAVICVDQGGVPVNIDQIRAACEPRGIAVVEDAACAVGSVHAERSVGASAPVATWSFHPRKLLTTGEGGMLTTQDGKLAARARRLREHGMSISAAERHSSVLAPGEQYVERGFNYRMTDLQAAVGLVQLAKLPQMVARRRDLARQYTQALRDTKGLRCVADPANGTSNFQSFWVEVSPGFSMNRDTLLIHLAERGISARRGIMAAHRQQPFRDLEHVGLPATEHLTDATLILPLYHEMSEENFDRVVGAIREVQDD